MDPLIDPRHFDLNGEVWFIILAAACLSTYCLKVVSQQPLSVLMPLLIGGGYLGNVAARALDLIPQSTYLTQQMAIDTTWATFLGMLIAVGLWICLIMLLPLLDWRKTVQRPNEPQGRVGTNG